MKKTKSSGLGFHLLSFSFWVTFNKRNWHLRGKRTLHPPGLTCSQNNSSSPLQYPVHCSLIQMWICQVLRANGHVEGSGESHCSAPVRVGCLKGLGKAKGTYMRTFCSCLLCRCSCLRFLVNGISRSKIWFLKYLQKLSLFVALWRYFSKI